MTAIHTSLHVLVVNRLSYLRSKTHHFSGIQIHYSHINFLLFYWLKCWNINPASHPVLHRIKSLGSLQQALPMHLSINYDFTTEQLISFIYYLWDYKVVLMIECCMKLSLVRIHYYLFWYESTIFLLDSCEGHSYLWL